MEPAWEQQPSEPADAYAAFVIYLQSPTRPRSIQKAYDAHLTDPEAMRLIGERHPREWRLWGNIYLWRTRAAHWDRVQVARVRAAREAVIEQQGDHEIEEFRTKLRTQAIRLTQMSQQLIDKTIEAIDKLDVSKIPVTRVPQYVQAAAQAAKVANSIHAQAIGLDEVLRTMVERHGVDVSLGDDMPQIEAAGASANEDD